jgi:hypothetical protein
MRARRVAVLAGLLMLGSAACQRDPWQEVARAHGTTTPPTFFAESPSVRRNAEDVERFLAHALT